MEQSIFFKEKEIKGLDGLRAIACLMVVFNHFSIYWTDFLGPSYKFVFDMGACGVSLFFVLSGFLITKLLIEEKKLNNTISIKKFLIKRISRILPVAYTYVLIVIILKYFNLTPVPSLDLRAAFLFFTNYTFETGPNIIFHFWSLCIEEHFYLVYPFVFYFTPIETLKKYLLYVVLASPFIRIITYLLLPAWRGKLQWMSHARMDALALGAWWAFIYTSNSTFYHDVKSFFLKNKNLILSISLVYLLLVDPFIHHTPYAGKYGLSLGFLLQGVFALFLLIISTHLDNRTKTYVLINNKWLRHFGIISYSLYVTHPIVTWTLPKINPVLAFLLIYLLALSVWFLVEYSLSAIIRKKLFQAASLV